MQRTIGVVGIGCYTAFSNNLDVELLQALHGRAPSVATGVKRASPTPLVFTLQGDGDMVNEGLQEVLHTAARGENVTCILLEQRRVRRDRRPHDRDDRDRPAHQEHARRPRRRRTTATRSASATCIAQLEGAAYVARGAVNNAGNVARTKKMIRRRVRGAGGRARASRSSRSSRCARPAGSSRRRRARLPDAHARAGARARRVEGRRPEWRRP